MKLTTFKMGLVGRLIFAILIGIGVGLFMPVPIIQSLITASSLFSTFLKFVIPFIILAFVIDGIADLKSGASKLLGLTTLISYLSTLLAALITYFVTTNTFKYFITSSTNTVNSSKNNMLSPFFQIPLAPVVDVTAAIVIAFMLGLGISNLRSTGKGEALYKISKEFTAIIQNVLTVAVVPLLPLYIAGTFANITYSGQIVSVLKVFWKVLLIVILLHLSIMLLQFIVAGVVSKKNPLILLKNQIPAYITALGTQSSIATLPVNLEVAKKNGVSKQIREFVIPLCATIHLSGSITSILSFSVAILMMNGMDYSLGMMIPYMLMLAVTMIAAPGAPGGAVMSALPLFAMVGISPDGALASLIIALHIAQDGFGTAGNISGDNAIACIMDVINNKMNNRNAS
ncbi:MAG: dicarboxylate/amino acid:cation symporter [Cellulosilyticaceae bacterium]